MKTNKKENIDSMILIVHHHSNFSLMVGQSRVELQTILLNYFDRLKKHLLAVASYDVNE